jgi:hypothetical protein
LSRITLPREEDCRHTDDIRRKVLLVKAASLPATTPLFEANPLAGPKPPSINP